MTDINDIVLDSAKTYKSLLDQIPPKTARELGEAARSLFGTWDKEGYAVTDQVIFGLLCGISIVQLGNETNTKKVDPTMALVGKMVFGDPGGGYNFALVTASAMAYEYVLINAPEALES